MTIVNKVSRHLPNSRNVRRKCEKTCDVNAKAPARFLEFPKISMGSTRGAGIRCHKLMILPRDSNHDYLGVAGVLGVDGVNCEGEGALGELAVACATLGACIGVLTGSLDANM